MKTERDVFDDWHFLQWKLHNAVTDTVDFAKVLYDRVYSHDHTSSVREVEFKAWTASAQRESSKLVPCNPTEEMWGGTARQLVKYMQMKDRYCPASLKKHFDRFIGDIPEWLNEEVNDWTSEHAFATADLGVFIYKAMYHEYKGE